MTKNAAYNFSLDPETVSIIGELAEARCGGNMSKAVRVMASEWLQAEHVKRIRLEKVQADIDQLAPRPGFVTREEWESKQATAAQFDRQWATIATEENPDAK